LEKFKRTELLIGKDGLDRLQGSCVAVFGLGGVGSYIAEALARSAVGKLILVDNDMICESNINRQLIALTSTIGKAKVTAAAERIREINPCIQILPLQMFYTAENAESFDMNGIDYIADAIDTVSSKLELIERADKRNIPIISCMGTGNKLDPTKFEIADIYKTSVCPLARVMRYELKKRGIKKLKVLFSTEPPVTHKSVIEEQTCKRVTPGSISFVPSVAGLIIAGEIIKDITGIR
jgi:tRNA A37 threonylcarbamoyladenosine dehydratase